MNGRKSIHQEIAHNPALQRFESQGQGVPPAYLSYRREGASIVVEHTFVPEEQRGRGLAGALARAALETARQQGWRVVPECTYVAQFIQRHPEFGDLVKRHQ